MDNDMTAGDFVAGLWAGGQTHMVSDETGHTNDGEYPFTHHEDNAWSSCPGCRAEGWV